MRKGEPHKAKYSITTANQTFKKLPHRLNECLKVDTIVRCQIGESFRQKDQAGL